MSPEKRRFAKKKISARPVIDTSVIKIAEISMSNFQPAAGVATLVQIVDHRAPTHAGFRDFVGSAVAIDEGVRCVPGPLNDTESCASSTRKSLSAALMPCAFAVARRFRACRLSLPSGGLTHARCIVPLY